MSTILASRKLVAFGQTHSTRFGYKDTAGREFGARARIDVIEFVAKDETDAGWGGFYLPEADLGIWFSVSRHATRNGQDYGAYPGHKRFRTEAEALAYIADYFASAEKRAAKNKARA